MQRCPWPNLENSEIYKAYHDLEWGVPCFDDGMLFELFILETFHCGLSWLLVLKKREAFRVAFDQFNPNLIADYNETKITQLMSNPDIIRNRAKILATIQNAKSFLSITEEFEKFSNYIWSFSDHKVIYHPFDGVTKRNQLSDLVSKDLKKRGFKFMGSVTCFSYLEAIGIMNNHAICCDLYNPNEPED